MQCTAIERHTIQNPHFEFFNQHINPNFKKDTNNSIDPFWFYLAYPYVEIECNRQWIKVFVKKRGLNINPDCYPFFKFLEENKEFCELIIKSSSDLQTTYEAWAKNQTFGK